MLKTYFICILGTDESRKEIEAGSGLSKLQLNNGYIYGIKDNVLHKINEETGDATTVAENITDYLVNGNTVYAYRYDKDKTKIGIYDLSHDNKLLINAQVYQMIMDSENFYVVTGASTERSLVKYSLEGNKKTVLTEKNIVSNIIQDDEYIYYSNKSDNNKIYRVKKDSTTSELVSTGSCVVDGNNFNGNYVMCAYGDKVIYINSKDNKIYVTGAEQDTVIVDNAVSQMQLKGHMLYFAMKDKIEIYRYNLEKSELQKITSARISEMICIN